MWLYVGSLRCRRGDAHLGINSFFGAMPLVNLYFILRLYILGGIIFQFYFVKNYICLQNCKWPPFIHNILAPGENSGVIYWFLQYWEVLGYYCRACIRSLVPTIHVAAFADITFISRWLRTALAHPWQAQLSSRHVPWPLRSIGTVMFCVKTKRLHVYPVPLQRPPLHLLKEFWHCYFTDYEQIEKLWTLLPQKSL